MKVFSNRSTSKQIFSALLLAITGIGIAHGEPSPFEKSFIEGQLSNFRSSFQSCQGWWYPPAQSVYLNNVANNVAQDYSDYMADHGGSEPSDNVQNMLNNELNNVVAIDTKIHTSNQPNHLQALTEWINAFQSCNDIMLTGQNWAGIGVGKSKSSSGQLYWTLIIFKQARLSSTDPLFLNQIYTSNVIQPVAVINNQLATQNMRIYDMHRTDADLIITDFKKIGAIEEVHEDHYEVAVRVVVENQGTDEASTFRIGIWASDSSNPRAVPFTVAGQRDTRNPLTSTTLYPGESIAMEGKVSFHPALTGKTLKLFAMADDCSNESEFNYCEVYEADEKNNESEVLLFNNPYSAHIKLRAVYIKK